MKIFTDVVKGIVLMLLVALSAVVGYLASGYFFGFEESQYAAHIGGILLFGGTAWYFLIVRASENG